MAVSTHPRSVERVLALAATFRRAPGTPVHTTITAWLRDLIHDDLLSPGDRLPSERALAEALGVSRMTLRQALNDLHAEGRLDRRLGAGGGSFVQRPRLPVDISDLVGLSPQLLRSVPSVTSSVVARETIAAPPVVGQALRLDGAPVHLVMRVRRANGEPVVLERSYFPADRFPDLLEHDLSGSLYALMRLRYGAEPVDAVEELAPILPGPEAAALLQMSPSQPALQILRTAYAADARPVEYSDDVFCSHRLRIITKGSLTALPAADRPVPDRQGEGPAGRG